MFFLDGPGGSGIDFRLQSIMSPPERLSSDQHQLNTSLSCVAFSDHVAPAQWADCSFIGRKMVVIIKEVAVQVNNTAHMVEVE